MIRRLALTCLLILTASFAQGAERASDLERMTERLIAQRIDAARASEAPDAPVFEANAVLIDIARRRSQDMAEGRAPFAHQDARGENPAWNMARWWMPQAHMVGENIMMQEREGIPYDADHFAQTAVDGWMKSPGHRRNILDPGFTWAGIGVAIRGNKAYATQIFAGPDVVR
jgi:uncharacterized protein YkwD